MSEGLDVGEHIVPFLVSEPDKVQTLVDFVARVAFQSAQGDFTDLNVKGGPVEVQQEAKELFRELEQETRDELVEASQYNLFR